MKKQEKIENGGKSFLNFGAKQFVAVLLSAFLLSASLAYALPLGIGAGGDAGVSAGTGGVVGGTVSGVSGSGSAGAGASAEVSGSESATVGGASPWVAATFGAENSAESKAMAEKKEKEDKEGEDGEEKEREGRKKHTGIIERIAANGGANAGLGLGIGLSLGASEKELENAQEEVEKEKHALLSVKARFGEKLEELREERSKALAEIRVEIKGRLQRLERLRGKGRLSEEEKEEFKAKAQAHVQQSFEERIRVAERLELEGADQVLVTNFISFARGQQQKFGNASTNEERRGLVLEFNAKWREFKQEVVRGFIYEKIIASVAKARLALDRMDKVIARLNASGSLDANASAKLENASAQVHGRLDAVAQASSLKQALWRLKFAHKGLVELKAAIQKAINGQELDWLKQEAEPAHFESDVALGASANASASTQEGASAAASATATATG